MAHDDLQLLRTVRQARQYSDKPISDDDLNELLEVARWTGSSRNTQPWHFIAVQDKDTLKQLSDIRTPINWLSAAPAGIAIVMNGESEAAEAYDEGRVTERIMVAARMLGMGGGIAWFGSADEEARAKDILGIPAERKARSIVAVGYPTTTKDPRPNPAQAGRRPFDEVISFERMGD